MLSRTCEILSQKRNKKIKTGLITPFILLLAETKICKISRSLDCNVNKEDLDACHWLKDKEQVIVKFCQRKDCEKVLKAKNDLRKLDATNIDLPEGSNFFVNQSLYHYYRLLWSTSKKLHGKGRTGQLT